MRLLIEFTYLQVLDILTTLAFLLQGVAEGNPIVRLAFEHGPGPVQTLIAMKAAAVVLAAYCLLRARQRLLRGVNIFFAMLVAYNLVVLIVTSPALQ
ncbi:MAG: hypothetical protein GC160_22670 [Acidobacteria bacterium]|nr:hypothetical protein [Acidobacteriota bacterium]